VVADLGLSITHEDLLKEYSRSGTPGFIAPEILRKGIYDSKADVFSIGCILFRILTKKYLFIADSMLEAIKLNERCDLSVISMFFK
jgi:serine/threonine protein kinase